MFAKSQCIKMFGKYCLGKTDLARNLMSTAIIIGNITLFEIIPTQMKKK